MNNNIYYAIEWRSHNKDNYEYNMSTMWALNVETTIDKFHEEAKLGGVGKHEYEILAVYPFREESIDKWYFENKE